MKSLFLLFALSTLPFVKNGFSQVIEPSQSFRVTRYDFGPGIPGYANATLTLTIKANSPFGGTTTAAKTYPVSNTTQQAPFSNSAILSGPYTFQISGMFPGNTSNWYTLPTTVGGETDVIATDPGMTFYSGGYGFSVTVKCVAARTYEIRPTRFECYIVPCPGGGVITSGTAILQSQSEPPVIFPNPVNTHMNLSFYAAEDQSLNIVITDVLGRKVQNVQHNAKAGKNVLPIATDQLSAGNYFVNFILDNQSTVLKCSKQ